MLTDHGAPRLHPEKRAWLDLTEDRWWNWIERTGFCDHINVEDLVLIAGASPGIHAFIVNESLPVHTIIVDDVHSHDEMLRLNFEDRRGVTVVQDNPTHVVWRLVEEHKPSVLLLDLGGRLLTANVIAMLASRIESVRVLGINYGSLHGTERASGLNQMLLTWHTDVDSYGDELRWTRLNPLSQNRFATYLR